MEYKKGHPIKCGFCKQAILQFKRNVKGSEFIDIPNQLEWLDGSYVDGRELAKCPKCAKSITALIASVAPFAVHRLNQLGTTEEEVIQQRWNFGTQLRDLKPRSS